MRGFFLPVIYILIIFPVNFEGFYLMQRLLYLIPLLVLIGCSSTNNKTASSHTNTMFDNVNRLACSIKYADSNQFCTCFVSVLSEVTPVSIKQKTVEGEPSSTNDLASIMIQHSDKLNQCEVTKTPDLSISNIKLTALGQAILLEHKDKILTPENRFNLVPHLTIGYEFSMEQIGEIEKRAYSEKLVKVDQNAFYFSLLNNGVVERESLYKYQHGDLYLRAQSTTEQTIQNEYKIPYNYQCQFVIGKCSSVSHSGLKKTVYTEFREGYWISNQPTFGVKRKIVIKIFGIDGLPLYEYNLFQNGRTSEYVRKQRNK
ncbi:hypothetical protein [Shewanella frigidimarina]|uniref:Uncharacterized protein n=1 Tax=Shewanella frigidimarina TaxID=56812 RepID=A0A106C1Y8_SHEFR|nr:hypothetical protein [Shewanella frigidimarina]KVX02751.1 hypothetical protein AWJ07_12720 [Shewanella frigidimarina]